MTTIDLSSSAARRRIRQARAAVALALLLALSIATLVRNALWRSDLSIWSDTAAKSPANAIVSCNLGKALLAADRTDDAIVYLRQAVRLDPLLAEAHYDLACAYDRIHRFDDAIGQYRRALAIRPDDFKTRFNLAVAYLSAGRRDNAREEMAAALRIRPESEEARAFSRYLLSIAPARTSR